MFSSQARGELGGQEPWTSGDKVGDGRNTGRTEADRVPNGKFPGASWGGRGRGEAPRGSGWQCLHPAHASGSWRRRSSGCGVGGWGRSGFAVKRERLGGHGQQVADGGKAVGYAGVWTQADFNRIVYTRWRKQRSLTVGQRAPKNRLSITHHQGSANQHHRDMPPHTHEAGY